jgi:hypothetical protein
MSACLEFLDERATNMARASRYQHLYHDGTGGSDIKDNLSPVALLHVFWFLPLTVHTPQAAPR